MSKPTKAHMSQSWAKQRSQSWKDMKKKQIKYYMEAKLLNIGINPKDAVYSWSMEIDGNQEIWTYNAYWGEAKKIYVKEIKTIPPSFFLQAT